MTGLARHKPFTQEWDEIKALDFLLEELNAWNMFYQCHPNTQRFIGGWFKRVNRGTENFILSAYLFVVLPCEGGVRLPKYCSSPTRSLIMNGSSQIAARLSAMIPSKGGDFLFWRIYDDGSGDWDYLHFLSAVRSLARSEASRRNESRVIRVELLFIEHQTEVNRFLTFR